MGHLVLRTNKKGRGVYTSSWFFTYARTVVLEDPALVFPNRQFGPKLHAYTFDWGGGQSALAMGLGSFINHSYDPNLRYEMLDRKKGPVIRFIARRLISPGEELTINYNYDPNDRSPVGFKVIP